MEHVCDLLLRLNGYTRSARLQYEKKGADAEEHVKYFLLNYGDDNLMDFIYPLRLDDIQQVEKIIIHRLLSEKRKKQRYRVIRYHSPDTRQRRFQENRQTDDCYEDKSSLDDRHGSKSDAWRRTQRHRQEDRMIGLSDGHHGRKNWSVHYNTGKVRRITLAAATTKELWSAIDDRRAKQDVNI